MMLPDVNVLLYAVDETSARHQPARAWVEEALSGTDTVGFAWLVLLAFVRLSTRPQVMANPMGVEEAVGYLEEWLARPQATVVTPTPRHPRLLAHLLDQTGTAGNLTSDAHLAALALEHAGTVWSFDTDFARFPEVAWRAPGAD